MKLKFSATNLIDKKTIYFYCNSIDILIYCAKSQSKLMCFYNENDDEYKMILPIDLVDIKQIEII